MTSNSAFDSRFRVVGCLTPTAEVPRLAPYFEARGAALVRECAAAIAAATTAGPLSAEAFTQFCGKNGVTVSALEAGLHSVRISALGAAVPLSSLISYLIDDFTLLERWILAHKGPLYPSLLFGNYRAVPLFEDGSECLPVNRFVAEQLDGFGAPFEGVLVDDGRCLRITPPGLTADAERLRALLSGYADHFFWVLLFSR